MFLILEFRVVEIEEIKESGYIEKYIRKYI
jgi:hypothetical protein